METVNKLLVGRHPCGFSPAAILEEVGKKVKENAGQVFACAHSIVVILVTPFTFTANSMTRAAERLHRSPFLAPAHWTQC